jgi:hypothetical protein
MGFIKKYHAVYNTKLAEKTENTNLFTLAARE